jgi:hypothetical protein
MWIRKQESVASGGYAIAKRQSNFTGRWLANRYVLAWRQREDFVGSVACFMDWDTNCYSEMQVRSVPRVHLLELRSVQLRPATCSPAPQIQSGLSCRHASNHRLTL